VDTGMLEDATPRRGTGCAECGHSGYRGRTGVFEMLVVDPDLRRVLVREPTERAITAATSGMPSLFHSAVAKALAGETTFDEVLRVSPGE
jgi:type IV pilus assembly protein PilB